MQKWDKFLLLLTVDRYRYEYVSEFTKSCSKSERTFLSKTVIIQCSKAGCPCRKHMLPITRHHHFVRLSSTRSIPSRVVGRLLLSSHRKCCRIGPTPQLGSLGFEMTPFFRFPLVLFRSLVSKKWSLKRSNNVQKTFIIQNLCNWWEDDAYCQLHGLTHVLTNTCILTIENFLCLLNKA